MKSFYVSGTFKDMQAERDLLHRQIVPLLRRQLRACGEDLRALDLRWGMDASLLSEEESGAFVIGSCLDGIDRCRPYMVVLIGERYGWIPSPEAVRDTGDERLSRWDRPSVSITQMELLYGALEQGDLSRCLFCFRDGSFSDSVPQPFRSLYASEGPEHREKLEALKDRIRKTPGVRLLEYSPRWDEARNCLCGLDDFARDLTAALTELLAMDPVPRSLSPEERVLADARKTQDRSLAVYVPRQERYESSVVSGLASFWFHGKRGCGTTSLLSSIARGAQAANQEVFRYYCENRSCRRVDVFLHTLLFWLCGECKIPFLRPASRSSAVLQIVELLERPRTGDWAILVDGVDRFEEDPTEIFLALAGALRRASKGSSVCSFAVSSSSEFCRERKERLRMGGFRLRELNGMLGEDVVSVAQAHAAFRGKRLDAQAQKAIREKPSCANPYYLSLVLQRLFLMRGEDLVAAEALSPGMEGSSRSMEQTVRQFPDDLFEMTSDTLRFAVERLTHRCLGLREGPLFDPLRVLHLLAVSRNGLTVSDLEAIATAEGAPLLPVVLQRLFSFLYGVLAEDREGRWTFAHGTVRETVLASLSPEQRASCAGAIGRLQDVAWEDRFDYALLAEDGEALQGCLHPCVGEAATRFAPLFRDHWVRVGRSSCLKVFPGLRSDFFARVLSDHLCSHPEEVLSGFSVWEEILEAVDETHGSPESRFALCLARLSLLRFGDRPEAYLEQLSRAGALYKRFETLPDSLVRSYFRALAQTLYDVRFLSDEETVRSLFYHFEDSPPLNRCDPSLRAFLRPVSANLRNVFFARKEIENNPWNGVERMSLVAKSMTQLAKTDLFAPRDPKTPEEDAALRGLDALICQTAERFNEWGSYREAFLLIKELIPRYETKMSRFPSPDDRILYANLMVARVHCTKAAYCKQAVEHHRNQWEILFSQSPLPWFLRKKGFSYDLEFHVLEKGERDGTVSEHHKGNTLNVLRRGIEIYDFLLDGEREDGNATDSLETLCFLRARRITKRLQWDIWSWEEEQRLAVACNGVLWGDALMKDDLARLEAQVSLLRQRDSHPKRLHQWAEVALLGLQYADLRQDKSEVLRLSEEFFRRDEELRKVAPKDGLWTRVERYLSVGEALERCGASGRGAECARMALSTLEALPETWIERRGYRVEARRKRVRGILLQMKGTSPEQIGQHEEWYQQAFSLTDPREEPLPKEDDPLRSDLKQTLGEIYAQRGDRDDAILLLKESAAQWPQDLRSMRFPPNEPKVQKQFRFLLGQLRLSDLTADRDLLCAVLERLKVLGETRTVNGDCSSRPALLQAAREGKRIWMERFPRHAAPEAIFFLLSETEDSLKQARMLHLIPQVDEAIRALERWENTHETLGDPDYFQLLETASRLQQTLIDTVTPESDEHLAVIAMTMDLSRKRARYFLAVRNLPAAVSHASFFASQYLVRTQALLSRYSAADGWEWWCFWRTVRRSSPFFKRSVQVDWENLTRFAIALCVRQYEETGDLVWLDQAVAEGEGFRQDLLRHPCESADRAWCLETVYGSYTEERRIYERMQADGRIPESVWLGRLLASLDRQRSLPYKPTAVSYRNTVTWLTALLDHVSDVVSVQKALDRVTESRTKMDDLLQSYLQKAVRDLPEDSSLETVLAYIEGLRSGSADTGAPK